MSDGIRVVAVAVRKRKVLLVRPPDGAGWELPGVVVLAEERETLQAAALRALVEVGASGGRVRELLPIPLDPARPEVFFRVALTTKPKTEQDSLRWARAGELDPDLARVLHLS